MDGRESLVPLARSVKNSGPGFRPASNALFLGLTWLAFLSACGGGDRQVAGPPGGGDGNGGSGLATLTVHVGVAAEDEGLAQDLGWESGVPSAVVHVLRNGEAVFKTTLTGSDGVAEFFPVFSGLYRVYATRKLGDQEAQAVGEPIRAFGDGRTVEIKGRPTDTLDLKLLSDRPGGLVISEIGNWSPPSPETGNVGYNEAVYFEVHNGSDATIFLDGFVFAVTFWTGTTNPTPCTVTQGARTDPAGVYVGKALRFPGGGSQYPIGPGEAKVIPISAIDHTSVHPELYDLSGADFEIRGAGSADNPSVPDMLDVGLEPFVTPFAGISLSPLTGGDWAYVLSEPFDPQSLPIMLRDGNGRGFVRAPADLIVDVVSTANISADRDPEFPSCSPTVHPSFDRYEGGFQVLGVVGPRQSYQRRVLRVDGLSILQDTNTSAFDIIKHEPTPGTLPLP